MTPVFLDTVGLLAVWDIDDQWHAVAETAYHQIVSQRISVITSTFILLECANAAARRSYRTDVNALRKALELRGELVVPSQDDWLRAWDAYERGQAGHAGIIDHVSFVIMRRLGVTDAFTNDRLYQAAGFRTLF